MATGTHGREGGTRTLPRAAAHPGTRGVIHALKPRSSQSRHAIPTILFAPREAAVGAAAWPDGRRANRGDTARRLWHLRSGGGSGAHFLGLFRSGFCFVLVFLLSVWLKVGAQLTEASGAVIINSK